MATKNRLIFLALILLTLLTIFLVFQNISKKQMVCWDEGNNIYVGNTITQAIRHRNWPKFWQLTLSQLHYPFFQSWYLGFISLPFEYTIESSRLVSLFLLLPAVILMWFLAQKLSRQEAVGFLAVIFLLTSPNLLLLFSMVLKEGFGATLTLLTFFGYLTARQHQKISYYFITGLSLLLVMLTKYNFGVLVLGVLGLESIIWLIREKKYLNKNYWLFNLCLYLPLTIGMTIWIALQPNQGQVSEILLAFKQFMLPGQENIFNLYETNFGGHLLFYPLELAFAYTFSWLAFLFLTAGFIFSFSEWRDYKVRVLGLFFLVNFLAAEKNIVNNQGRYIATCVPFFFLVGSDGLVNLYSKVRKIKLDSVGTGLLAPILIFAIFTLIKDFISFPKYLPGLASHEILSAVFYQQDYLPGGKYISMFDFDRNNWPKIPPESDMEKIPDVMNFILDNVDLSKTINFAGFLNEFSPGLAFFYVDKAREKLASQGNALRIWQEQPSKYQEYFAVILVEDGTRFDTYAYRIFTHLNSLYEAKQVLSDKSLTLIKQKEFKDLGLTVRILGR